jgi:hypothetical protein
MTDFSPDDPLLSDAGLEALHEAAFACGVDTSSWARPGDAVTIGETLLANASHDEASAKLVARARLRLRYRGVHGVTLELAGRSDFAVIALQHTPSVLESAVTRTLDAAGFPPHARVSWIASDDETHVEIALPSRWMRVIGEDGRASLGYRFSHATASVARATRRLRVAAATYAHAGVIVSALGEIVAADARFFRAVPIVSLRALQRSNGAVFIPGDLASSIARVRVIDCDWDSGRAIAIGLRGSDVPKDAGALGLRVDSGRLHHATLRVEMTRAPHRCDVTLQPPNEIAYSEPSCEPLVRALLEANGVLGEDDAPRDLWSLDPWTPSNAEARAFFGDAFLGLRDDRILVRSRSRAVAHPEHPEAGRVLIAFPIEGEEGAWYGVSEAGAVPSCTLRDADLVTWRIKMKPLGERIARALRLTGDVRVFARGGVVDLGWIKIGPAKARLFLITRAPVDPATLGAWLRLRAMPGHVVLLVPPGRTTGTGLAEVEMANVAGPYEALLADAARALGLAKHIDPLLAAPASARVVIHRASRRFWFDGVLVHPLPEQAYRLAEILAMRAGAAMNVKELGRLLSANRSDDAITRQAKRALMKAIAASFAREKRVLPKDAARVVESAVRGEVRMGVEAFVA